MTGRFTLSVDVEGLWGLFFVRSYVEDPTAARAGRCQKGRWRSLTLRTCLIRMGSMKIPALARTENLPEPVGSQASPTRGWKSSPEGLFQKGSPTVVVVSLKTSRRLATRPCRSEGMVLYS